MKPIGPRLIAVTSTLISAVSGVLANIITNHWTWTLAMAFTALVIAASVLAWWDRQVPDTHHAGITQTARRGGRIEHATVHSSNGAAIRQEADHKATITNSRLHAEGATITQRADDAAITDTELKATD